MKIHFKKYKIVYQQNENIETMIMEANDELSARYWFYVNHYPNHDIISIEEITEESNE